MAFIFTVEDGTLVAGANSYVSVEEADDLISINIHAAPEWAALDVATKEKLLAWASRFLDVNMKWIGVDYPSSMMMWPRAEVVSRDGFYYTGVPDRIKLATAEMARFLMSEDRTVSGGGEGLTRIKADVIELEFDKAPVQAAIPAHIARILSPLGVPRDTGGMKIRKLVR